MQAGLWRPKRSIRPLAQHRHHLDSMPPNHPLRLLTFSWATNRRVKPCFGTLRLFSQFSMTADSVIVASALMVIGAAC